MTHPNTRRGNRGEMAVKLALERQGLVVRNGAGSESGADLFVFTPSGQLLYEAEVKTRKAPATVNGLTGKAKASLARRAHANRKLGWDYRLFFITRVGPVLSAQASIYSVGELVPSTKHKGLHLTLYEGGKLSLPLTAEPPQGVGDAAPITRAESRAVSQDKTVSRSEEERTGFDHRETAARPAIEVR